MQLRGITDSQLEEILNGAVDLTDNQAAYITNIRLTVSSSEVILSFYRVAPNHKSHTGLPIAYLHHTVILPLGLAKNIGKLLLEQTSVWEDVFGISLPFTPNTDEFEIKTEGEHDVDK